MFKPMAIHRQFSKNPCRSEIAVKSPIIYTSDIVLQLRNAGFPLGDKCRATRFFLCLTTSRLELIKNYSIFTIEYRVARRLSPSEKPP